jgi:lipid-A-disaccharide synthase-like uncharacterized protein
MTTEFEQHPNALEWHTWLLMAGCVGVAIMLADIFTNHLWGYGGAESAPLILSGIFWVSGVVGGFATIVHIVFRQAPIAVRIRQVILLTAFLVGFAFVGSLV